MTERGIALTPTLRVLTATLDVVRERPDGPRKDWYLRGATAHPSLVAAAAEAGVTILADTDPTNETRFAARNACSVLASRYTSRCERICAQNRGP